MIVWALVVSGFAAFWLVIALAYGFKARWAQYSTERDKHRESFLGVLVVGLLLGIVSAILWVLWAVGR